MIDKSESDICLFIERRMCFFSYDDFCQNCEKIKKLYQTLKPTHKRFYKWYVYREITLQEFLKNKIWDYLNGYDDGTELMKARKFAKRTQGGRIWKKN